MIAGQFVCNKLAYPQNILHCFRAEQVKIGDVTMALNDSTYFVEQDLCRTLKPMLSKYERGILLKDPEVFEGVNYQSGDCFDQPIIPVLSSGGVVTFEGSGTTINSYPHAFQTALKANFLKLSDKGDQWVVNFAFPLHLVAPSLKYLQDGGAVFAGKNQPVQLTLALTPASESMFCINGGSAESNFTYTIKNLQLMDVYTVLDAPRLEMI